MKTLKYFIPIVAVIIIVLLFAFGRKEVDNLNNGLTNINTNTETSMPQRVMSLSKPEMMIDQNKTYRATLVTSEGEITIELNDDATPITVNNFVYLARNNFYDNTTFHRVITGFMIQGGDPRGDGTGGPGYRFDDEPFEGEYERGVVAMANAGPNTNGSQFFIMLNARQLPKNYVIFGRLIIGSHALDVIAGQPVGPNANGEMSRPLTPIVINDVRIGEE